MPGARETAVERVSQPDQFADSANAVPRGAGELPNQPARIAINPRDFVRDLQTGFARLQQQAAECTQAEEQQRRERYQQVVGSLDDIDRDRLAEWRRDDREQFDSERDQ